MDKIRNTTKKVVDIGCGPGIYVNSINNENINCIGIDNDPRVQNKQNLVQKNLLNHDILEKYDLVLCLEVAEHIDPMYSDDIVRQVYNFIDRNGILLWSSAIPGQGGIGHINCRSKQYWKDKFIKLGLIHDDNMQKHLVKYCKEGFHMGWFTQNVMCFRKSI